MSLTLPHACYRLRPKAGDADCVVTAMATIFQRDYGEVLIAAARVHPQIWKSGLPATTFERIARRLKVKVRWNQNFDPDDDTGLLWVAYNDTNKEHVVPLIEGWVFETEHDPVSMWRYSDYLRVQNAYSKSLLQVVE